jgi:hypothetical protein
MLPMASNRGRVMDSKRDHFLTIARQECGARPGTELARGGAEASMKRNPTTEQEPKIRLALKKETLKDLSPKQNPRGGFIMKDTIIIKTSGR